MGHRRLDHQSFQSAEEPTITGELVRSMQEELEADTAPGWAAYLAIRDDPPQNVEGRLGKRRRRIDIEIERCSQGKRPRFRFEAKRLRDSASLSAYLGEDGLMLFVQGSYAPDNDEAGMLGYVQQKTPVAWSRHVGDRLSAASKQYHLRPDGSLQRVNLTDRIEECHESFHDRPSLGRPIRILHTFLVFQ